MRLLYLDDSGKISPKHPSKFLVYAGFSVDAGEWQTLTRRITGAKYHYYPNRGSGRPDDWELKTENFLRPNEWKRSNNRRFCNAVVDILDACECRVYAVGLEKQKAKSALNDRRFVPLMFQRMAAKFADELSLPPEHGAIVCDWSTHGLDRHVSNCIQTFAFSNKLDQLVGGVSYASSQSLAATQVADLIAGAFRISWEGGMHVAPLIMRLNRLRHRRSGTNCVCGYPVDSVFRLF
jgi:hypothetical protein